MIPPGDYPQKCRFPRFQIDLGVCCHPTRNLTLFIPTRPSSPHRCADVCLHIEIRLASHLILELPEDLIEMTSQSTGSVLMCYLVAVHCQFPSQWFLHHTRRSARLAFLKTGTPTSNNTAYLPPVHLAHVSSLLHNRMHLTCSYHHIQPPASLAWCARAGAQIVTNTHTRATIRQKGGTRETEQPRHRQEARATELIIGYYTRPLLCYHARLHAADVWVSADYA